MKRFLMIAALGAAVSGVSSGVMAAEVGVGVSLRSNDSTIYVPIDINDSFRVEPLLRYSQTKSVTGDNPFELENRMRSFSIGTGLFALHPIGDSVVVYYGGRLAFVSTRIKTTGFEPDPFFGYVRRTNEVDSRGFSIAPTLGAEYRFAKAFSIAGEASLTHTKLSGENDGTGDVESASTTTNIVFRYRF